LQAVDRDKIFLTGKNPRRNERPSIKLVSKKVERS